jgi:hypothetical protein
MDESVLVVVIFVVLFIALIGGGWYILDRWDKKHPYKEEQGVLEEKARKTPLIRMGSLILVLALLLGKFVSIVVAAVLSANEGYFVAGWLVVLWAWREHNEIINQLWESHNRGKALLDALSIVVIFAVISAIANLFSIHFVTVVIYLGLGGLLFALVGHYFKKDVQLPDEEKTNM